MLNIAVFEIAVVNWSLGDLKKLNHKINDTEKVDRLRQLPMHCMPWQKTLSVCLQ